MFYVALIGVVIFFCGIGIGNALLGLYGVVVVLAACALDLQP